MNDQQQGFKVGQTVWHKTLKGITGKVTGVTNPPGTNAQYVYYTNPKSGDNYNNWASDLKGRKASK